MIERASADPRFRDHPGLAEYGIESYIAVPLLRADGSYFGTLCALDPKPARLPDEKLEIFNLLAELIASQLEQEEMRTEREHFIAALGHDLRSPLNAIATSAATLGSLDDVGDAARPAVGRIARSAQRMQTLVDDLLDVARGRLGERMELRRSRVDLAPLIRRVVDEVSDRHEPGVSVKTRGDLILSGDQARLGQLVSNLLVNAIEHGGADEIRVLAEPDGGDIVLEVANGGEPIPQEILPRLFEPFTQTAGGDGLGLGLYISAQVVQAHGGTIDVVSDRAEGTRFTARLPRTERLGE